MVKPDELYSKPDKVKKENASTKMVRPEELYTQPEKVKKKNKSRKKDSQLQVNGTEDIRTCPMW